MIEIDFHTHHLKKDNTIQIVNYLAHNLPVVENRTLYSIGIHPWHIKPIQAEQSLKAMEKAMEQSNVIAVGECGLDRTIGIDFALQEELFDAQIKLAKKYSKPLIIHCVHAYPDLIKLKKQNSSSLPWIIHGFQGNEQTVIELIKHDFYFSVGEGLLNKPQHKEIFKMIPTDHLFLETDDRDIPINHIYTLAAKMLKIKIEALEAIILNNFKNIFENNSIVDEKIRSSTAIQKIG